MSKNPVVHFEMPYKDEDRVSNFYKEAFGWQMIDTGEEMGHYVMAQTAETDKDRMVKTPGAINGGFFPLSASPNSIEPSVVISVDDIEMAMKAVEKAGGTLFRKTPNEIPGVGLFIAFRDTEGNRVSLLQAMRG